MTSIKYNELTNTIEKIEFCVFGNDEIKRYSAVSKDIFGIVLPETSNENGKPKKGGLNDPRLGITDYNNPCATCGLDMNECQGHPGHTELPEPVFHLGFINIVKSILSCICIRCSNLLVHKSDEEILYMLKNYSAKKRFAEIKKAAQNIKACNRPEVGCGKPVPKIKEEKNKKTANIQLVAEVEEENEETPGEYVKIKEYLSAERIYEIFKNVSDLDCRILGINTKFFRPDDFIIKNFVIPPVAIRPSAKLEALGSSYEDMMTHKLVDIIKNVNNRRKQKEKKLAGGEGKYDMDSQHLLQYHIATYYDNDSLALPKSEQKTGNRASKSVSERLKGKHGRVRGNLLGKRVDYSARSVITSDPNIGVDELGVPIRIAMNLTFPEIVTPDNYDKLLKLVKNGRDSYPGANYVVREKDKKKLNLKYVKESFRLEMGDIVHRHLQNGDIVLFNRQPTLHKLSMMGHRIKVINDIRFNTFRLNVDCTTPYNAD